MSLADSVANGLVPPPWKLYPCCCGRCCVDDVNSENDAAKGSRMAAADPDPRPSPSSTTMVASYDKLH